MAESEVKGESVGEAAGKHVFKIPERAIKTAEDLEKWTDSQVANA